jgi:predicted DNA-binding transcriptional regulator AlpA
VTAARPDPIAYPPRGMSRDEAARYIGAGNTKFDEMVADGRMPRPKRVDGRVIWDKGPLDEVRRRRREQRDRSWSETCVRWRQHQRNPPTPRTQRLSR